MFSVTFVDHSDQIKEILNRKLLACVKAAAERIAESYVEGLQARFAPPHSSPGQIPHAFNGRNAYGEPNNSVLRGFAQDQETYLSNYIEGDAFGRFGDVEGFVGFRPSHVSGRAMNYLIAHDMEGRPWVRRLFDRNRSRIAAAAKTAFKEAE